MNSCSVSGCPTKPYARGWCEKHYARWRAHGDPTAVKYHSRPSPRVDQFIATGTATCDTHGEHSDWSLRERKDPRGNYRDLRCRPCQREASRRWNEGHPGYHDEYYASLRGRAPRLASGARRRALAHDLPYTISAAWIIDQFDRQQGRCAYSGRSIDLTVTGHATLRNPYGLSLDRIDPSDGYTPENTRLVCWIVNSMKGGMTLPAFQEMCREVAAHDDAPPRSTS